MREIKFRAWDYTSNVMRNDITEMVFNSDGILNQINVETGTDILFPEKECVLMQYIGLKDKNGVEIYEGDILSVAHQKYLSAGDERFYKNGYDNRVVKWRVTSHHNGWNIYNAPQTQFEVIGNIYENPELLEANQ